MCIAYGPALIQSRDVVLEQAAAVFSRPDVELELALDARLTGNHPREKAEQELFEQGKAQQGRP